MQMRDHFQQSGILLSNINSIILLLGLIFLLDACHKDAEETPISNEYLTAYSTENVLLLPTIHALLSEVGEIYPDADILLQHALYGVQVYSVSYLTHYKDSLITASGLICVPQDGGDFPVISFQNGTNTLHDNAPTANSLDFNYLLLEAMASNGYIILIPDYIGFGASEELGHPFYHRKSSDNAVIDLMQACREFLWEDQVSANGNGEYYLMGYSQGGWATISALDELEHNHKIDFSIKAASCGSGAYDLMAMSSYVVDQETFPAPLYLPYFIYSQQVYGALTDPLTKFFNEPYASRIPGLFNGSYSNGQVNEQLNDTIRALVTEEFINGFLTSPDFQQLRNVMEENSIEAWNTNTKVRLYHGTADLNIPLSQSSDLYDAFIGAGTSPSTISFIPLEGLTHDTGIVNWGLQSMIWFNSLKGK
jgi:hypothetical protein